MINSSQTVKVKGRTRSYNPRPEANAEWQRERFRAKLDALGIDPKGKKIYIKLEGEVDRLEQLERRALLNAGTPLANKLKPVIENLKVEIAELYSAVEREFVTDRLKPLSKSVKRAISHWSKKSRAHHCELANELVDLCKQSKIDPKRCLSVSLIPSRKFQYTKALTYAKTIKMQLKRLCDFIVRNGGVVIGVVEPFAQDPTCPHFHALVIVPESNIQALASKIRKKWAENHPGHKKAVIKSLVEVSDVLRVLLYPHNISKRQIPDRLGGIGNRVITGGLSKLPRIVVETQEIDSLIYVAQYLQNCERRGINVIDWRPLKFFACENLVDTPEVALDYLIRHWNHVIILGQTDAKYVEAWRILDVQYKKCDDGQVRVVLSVYTGSEYVEWPRSNRTVKNESRRCLNQAQSVLDGFILKSKSLYDPVSALEDIEEQDQAGTLKDSSKDNLNYSSVRRNSAIQVHEDNEDSFQGDSYDRQENVDDS